MASFLAKSQTPFAYQLSKKDGLPTNRVFDIHISQEGFLFAGTNRGLVKYDGKKFEHILKGDPGLNITEFNELDHNDLYFISFGGELFCYQHDSVRVIHKFKQPYPGLSKLSNNKLVFSGLNGFHTYQSNQDTSVYHALPIADTAGPNKKSEILGRTHDGVLIRCQNKLFLVNASLQIVELSYKTDPKIHMKSFRSAFYFGEKDYFFGFERTTGDAIVYQIIQDSVHEVNRFEQLKQSVFQHVYLQKEQLCILTKSGYHILHSDLRLDEKNYEPDKYLSEMIRFGSTQVLSTTTNGIWVTPDRTVKSGADLIPHKLVPFLHNHNNTIYYSTYEGGFYSIFPNKTFEEIKLPREAKVQTDFFGNYFSFSSTVNHHLHFDTKKLRKKDLIGYYGRVIWIEELDLYLVCGRKAFLLTSDRTSTINWIKKSFQVEKEKSIVFFNSKRNKETNNAFQLLSERVGQTYFNKQDSSLYLSTGEILYHFIPNQEKKIVLDKNDTLKPFGLLPLTNGTVILNTNDGLYKVKEDKLIPMLTTADGFDPGQVTGLKLVSDTFIYFGNHNIRLYTEKAGFFKTFSSHTNLPDGEIINATMRSGKLYIGTKSGFFVAPITPDKTVKPKAFIRYALAGQVRWPLSKKIPFDKNDLLFKVNGLDLLNRGAFHYEYKLDGSNNNDWIVQDAIFDEIRFSSLSEGDYTLQLKVVSDLGQESEVISYPFTVAPPFVRSWLFYLLCFLIALGIVSLIFYLRTRSIRRKAEFDKQVKQSEITAIKAQMNPHFVFNALNSIQSWVVTKDVKNSNLYLGKFSKLVRKTLEVSEKNAIPLSEEIYIIQLYLDLENLRFGEEIAIDFKVDIPEEEHDNIYVPAMLIQPYIENVFKHGLLHKKGAKELKIIFTKQDDKLVCSIQDNGVGRKRSAEINQKKKRHTSFSTRANEKRIEILNEMFNNEIQLEISDAFPEKEDCGTLISLQLPLLDFDSLNELSHSPKQ